MQVVAWDERFATGNSTVDHQHQQLFKMVNDLHTAIMEKRGKEQLLPSLELLARYVIEHFATEERLMREAGYPNSARHHACHVNLTAKANAIIQDYRSGKLVLTMSLSQFLADWIRHHIEDEDMALVNWLRARSGAHAGTTSAIR